jgi:hypothetical protein
MLVSCGAIMSTECRGFQKSDFVFIVMYALLY